MAKAYSRHKCAVEGCTSVSCKEEGVSLHRLPALESTRQAWFNTIPMPKLERPENIVICSKHFKDEDFKASVDETYKRRLKSDAVPSIFTPPELPTLQDSDSENDGSVAGDPMTLDYDSQVLEVDMSHDYISDDRAHAVSGAEYPEPTARAVPVPYCVACLASGGALRPLGPSLAATYRALLRDVDTDTDTDMVVLPVGWERGSESACHACHLCAALLRRAAQLRQRCRRAHRLLAEFDVNTPLINPAFLNTIDRKEEGLILPLSVHREANIDTNTTGTIEIELEPEVPLITESVIVDVKLEVEDAKDEIRTFVAEDDSIDNSLNYGDDFQPEDNIADTDVDDSDQELAKLARNKRKLKANPDECASKKIKTKKKFKSKSKKKTRKIKSEKYNKVVDNVNEENLNEPCKGDENNSTKDNAIETNQKKKYRKIYEGENAVSERRFRFASLHKDYWDIVELTDEEAMAAFKAKKDQPSYRWAKHPCKYCYVGFSMKSSLDMHMNFHSPSRGSLECKFCRRRFSKEGERKKHTLLHMYRYLCKRCDFKSSGRTTAKRHNQFHEGSTYTCKLCDTTFTKHSSYFGHMRFRHRSAHVCPGCGENYQSHPAARLHFRRQHPNCVWRTEPLSADDPLWCARCSLRFEDAPAFDTHLRTSKQHAHDEPPSAPSSKAEQSEDKNDKASAENVDAKKKPEGDVKKERDGEIKQECGEGELVVEVMRLDDKGEKDALFKGKKPGGSLKRKVRASIETVCPVCGAMFRSEVQYMKHHRREHKGTRLAYRYMCDQCGQTYPSAFTLQEHETVHSGRKRHVCPVCNRGFNHSSNYKRHMVVHTGEQPHACHVCDGRFTTRTGLTNHVKHIHEGVPWPRRNRHKDGLPPLDHINYYAGAGV